MREILEAITAGGHDAQTVCIGGVNGSNLERVMFQSSSPLRNLNGVAIVSALMAAPDPEGEARRLLSLVRAAPLFRQDGEDTAGQKVVEAHDIIALVPAVIKAVHDATPLSHNMTNLVSRPICTLHRQILSLTHPQVVQNFAANVALAVGASPIMANYGEEAPDLARLGGALVINMGTVTEQGLENYLKALRAYNQAGRPVIFDPVG